MSKVKLLETGGKYVGKKLLDVLKKIKHKKSSAKSKAASEKLGLGTKSIKRYNIRAGDKSDVVIPVKKQSQIGSTFQTHKVRGQGSTSTRGKGPGKVFLEGSAESQRADIMRTHGYGPSFKELLRSLKKKKFGGMLKLKRGGDNMPARNKKNFRPTKAGAGMTRAGVMAYRRKNPGSKLQTAVTGKVKPGSKAAKRRKSFCARSAGQMKKFPKAAANPNSRLRQARRRWKC